MCFNMYSILSSFWLFSFFQSYNNFIEKTKAELYKEPDPTPVTKPQIKDDTSAVEQSSTEPSPPHRYQNHSGQEMLVPANI